MTLALLPVDDSVPPPHIVTAVLRPPCFELLAEGARTAPQRQERERELYTGDIPDTGGEDGPEDDVEGVVRCSRCKSSDIRWDQKQTRGADESMTIFFECKSCGKRWKMS